MLALMMEAISSHGIALYYGVLERAHPIGKVVRVSGKCVSSLLIRSILDEMDASASSDDCSHRSRKKTTNGGFFRR